MFRFDKFTEHWASVYRPMLHQKGKYARNKRFYLTDTYMGLVDFMTNIRPDQSPCVVMESAQEGTMTDRFDYPRYSLYFMVRAEDMSDGESAMDAKTEAKQHMQKFMNYLRSKQEEDARCNLRTGISGIKIEQFMNYDTVGPFYDGWYGVQITLENLEAYSTCVSQDDYIEDTPLEEISKEY